MKLCMTLGILAGVIVTMGSSGLNEVQASEPPALKAGERVVFLGDSITQAGARPNGYVSLVRNAINQQMPDAKIEVIGAGISGNRVPDLQKRLERDVLSKQPTVVVIYIGINDVWHTTRGRGTPKDQFEAGLKDVVSQIQKSGARVILCTPSMIGEKTDGSNDLDEMLDEYSDISRGIAKAHKTQLIDLRKEFVAHLQQHNPENKSKNVLTSDGVHLNAVGNQFVAATMLAGLGVKTRDEQADKHAGKVLRHVVLFKFKDEVTDDQVQEVVDAFAALPKKIDAIIDFEHGTDVGVEGKSEGFTHGFIVTFKDAAGRDAYLPHPQHKEFGLLVRPRLEKVLVFDFYAKP